MESEYQGTFAGFTFPQVIAIMPSGTLAKRLAEFKVNHGKRVCGPYYRTKPAPNQTGMSFYLESDFMPAMRWEWADEVDGSPIDHHGWYSDEFGDAEKIRGIVMRLPSGRGFLAGWSMGESMASGLEYEIYEDVIDAVRAADGLAESTAEQCREDEEKYRQEQEENGEENEDETDSGENEDGE